jgi:hypothetical protein
MGPGMDRQQISPRVDFPDNESVWISPEAIYQALYVQSRGALRRELVACLRTGRALRFLEGGPNARRGTLTLELMISERPAEADERVAGVAPPQHHLRGRADRRLGRPHGRPRCATVQRAVGP